MPRTRAALSKPAVRAISIALWILLVSGRADAQSIFPPWLRVGWRPLGPEGGAIAVFAVYPSSLDFVYAGARDGTLWSSHDGGRTWEFVASLTAANRAGGVVSGLEVSALTLVGPYAAAGSAIVGCCLHGGLWATKGSITGDGDVRQLVASGSPHALVARVAPEVGSGDSPRLERSTDGGTIWLPAPLPEDAKPLELAAESLSSGRLYARTDRGVYRSLDFGLSWTRTNVGLPIALTALAMAPSASSTLYAFDEEAQLYRTVDGAESWRRRGEPVFASNPIAPIAIVQLVVDAADPSVLYLTALHHAGRRTFQTLHRSTDAGLTWRQLDASGAAAAGTLVSVPSSSSPTLLSALPDGGVVLSEDQGETFTATRGLQAPTIEALGASARPPSILYAAELPQTIATLAVGEQMWTKRQTLGLSPSTVRVRDLAADPHDPTVAWSVDDLSVLKITEAGRRVERLNTPFGLGASRLAVGSSLPVTLYVVGNDTCTLQKSTDAGATWSCPGVSPLAAPAARALEVDPRDPAVVHLVDQEGHLFRSLDGAASWETIPTAFDVTALAIDPLDGATLYAAAVGDGLWKSADHGSSWLLFADARNGLPLIPASATELLAHPVDPDRLYVTYAGRGVFGTVDGGATFHSLGFGRGEIVPSNTGLPKELISGPIAIDPQLPTRLYAGTRGAGVWTATHEEPSPCREDDRTLCLQDGRFRVQARWRDFRGRVGPGHAARLTGDSGYFWFFEPENLELMVKALDARPLNDRFWVFYGSLSNVEFQLLVTDTETGEVNAYFNPERQFASRGDTSAFPRASQQAERAIASIAVPSVARAALAPHDGARASAAAGEALLLVDDRFRVTVEWHDFQGNPGVGHARPLNDTSGTFWFFDEDNLEIAIKILDGRGLNGYFWVFYGALSNVEYRIVVEDTSTGELRTYLNPSGQFGSRGDTAAFRAP